MFKSLPLKLMRLLNFSRIEHIIYITGKQQSTSPSQVPFLQHWEIEIKEINSIWPPNPTNPHFSYPQTIINGQYLKILQSKNSHAVSFMKGVNKVDASFSSRLYSILCWFFVRNLFSGNLKNSYLKKPILSASFSCGWCLWKAHITQLFTWSYYNIHCKPGKWFQVIEMRLLRNEIHHANGLS